jgi:caa(3)-type oxidase subunit IV
VHAASDQHHGDSHGEHHGIGHYIKIYLILLVLLIISILGPELGIRSLTLITAFGIAVVKAGMVCAYFMHLNVEKRYIWYMLYGMLILVSVFFAGVATDIMKPTGQRWENAAALQLIEQHKAPAAEEHK